MFFRLIGYMLLAVVILTILRNILGFAARLFFNITLGSGAGAKQTGPRAGAPRVPQGGTLHKDPVCGTYVSESLAITMQDAGQTVWFCSNECRDKYRAAK